MTGNNANIDELLAGLSDDTETTTTPEAEKEEGQTTEQVASGDPVAQPDPPPPPAGEKTKKSKSSRTPKVAATPEPDTADGVADDAAAEDPYAHLPKQTRDEIALGRATVLSRGG